MKRSTTLSRAISIVYRFVLPAWLLYCMFIISPNLGRQPFLGSSGLDLFARLWIAFGYCGLYVTLSDIDRYLYKRYRIRSEENRDSNHTSLNLRNVALGAVLGIGSVPLTWWIIQFFFPDWTDWSLAIVLFHGLLLALPIAIRRKMFMF